MNTEKFALGIKIFGLVFGVAVMVALIVSLFYWPGN